MKNTEKEITAGIRRLLKNIGVFHWKQIGALGLPRGIADIIGIWDGKFLAIEVKKPGNNPTDEQLKFINAVNAAGGLAFVAYSVDDVIAALDIGDRFVDWNAQKKKIRIEKNET